MRDDFAVFILSHGRADRVVTVSTLRRCGYTGKIYIIIDDQDNDEAEYYERYGKDVIKFNKSEAAKRSDVMDSDTDMRIVLYARNECHRIAKELGLTYFLELDDDYNEFRFRLDKNGVFTSVHMSHLDAVFDAMLDFLEVSGAVTVAMAQSGDFVGGMGSSVWQKQLARKAMNSFFCKTDRPFQFLGRINEDVNAYTLLSSQGKLVLHRGKSYAQSRNHAEKQKRTHGCLSQIWNVCEIVLYGDVYAECGTGADAEHIPQESASQDSVGQMHTTDSQRKMEEIKWLINCHYRNRPIRYLKKRKNVEFRQTFSSSPPSNATKSR